MNAFSAAIDAIFADPNMAADALWLQGGASPGVPVRVVFRAPDEVTEFGAARIQQATTTIDVRVSDVTKPTVSDRFSIGGEFFTVQGTPRRDVRRLMWTVDLRPV